MHTAFLAVGLLAAGIVLAAFLGVGAWPWPARLLYAACVAAGIVGLLLWRGEDDAA